MKKQAFLIIGLFLSIFSGTNWLNAQTTYIQVVSEPGVSVFLDNIFKGRTTADIGGLIIENVTPGSRSIKVVKDGFNPQEDRINVKAGEVYTHRVRPFVPSIKIEQKGSVGEQKIDLQVGHIKIQSLPVAISISIPKLGVNSTKTQDEWMANEIPVGTYEAIFTWQGKTLKHFIEVRHKQQIHLFVNMMQLKVELRSIDAAAVFGSFKDTRDGRIYKTVRIGNQIWMAENLNYEMPGSFCYNNQTDNCKIYGRLYNWQAAQNACPPGWVLPSSKDFRNLFVDKNCSRRIMVEGYEYWNREAIAGNNELGFSALPGGQFIYGNYENLHNAARWWTNDGRDGRGYWFLPGIWYKSGHPGYYNVKENVDRFSIRCIKE
jgi:uncharacterized protein (TIGR02145 family)